MTFKYFNASSLDEAVELLRKERGHVIAGGTDLLRLANDGIVKPVVLISVGDIPEMKKIEKKGGNLSIGASVTLREIERSPITNDEFPMLTEAARLVATPQVRNMGTVGGNLLQDVQCWYHRNLRFDCFRRGGKSCQVPNGEHGPYHAISNAAECFAVMPSDLAPPLAALGAKVKVKSADGERTAPIEELYLNVAPWRAIGQDELLVSADFPLRSLRGKFVKHRILKSHSYAVASAAVALSMVGKVCSEARIFLGSVAPSLYRAVVAEEILKGETVGEGLANEAVDAMAQDFNLSRMNPWKAKVAKAICKRAILGAVSREQLSVY